MSDAVTEGVRVQVADFHGLFYHTSFVRRVETMRVLPALVDVEGKTATRKQFNLLPPPGINRLKRPGDLLFHHLSERFGQILARLKGLRTQVGQRQGNQCSRHKNDASCKPVKLARSRHAGGRRYRLQLSPSISLLWILRLHEQSPSFIAQSIFEIPHTARHYHMTTCFQKACQRLENRYQ